MEPALPRFDRTSANYRAMLMKPVILPEKITEKIWTEISDHPEKKERLFWKVDDLHKHLVISLQYCGGSYHDFKVSIYEEEKVHQKSFIIVLEDKVKNDTADGMRSATLEVDLNNYLYLVNNAKFKVIQLDWGSTATELGETTYSSKDLKL